MEDGFSGNSLDAFVWDYETDPPVQGRDANQLQVPGGRGCWVLRGAGAAAGMLGKALLLLSGLHFGAAAI